MMNKNKMNNCTLVVSVITLLIVILIPVFPNIIYSFIPLLFITIGLIGGGPNFNKITLIILFFIQSVALLMEVPVELTIGVIFRYMFSIFILLFFNFFMIYIYIHGSPFRKKSKRVKSTQPESSSISEDEGEVIIIKSNKCVDECTEIPVDLTKAIERYKSAIEGMSDEEVMDHFPWFSSVGYSLIEDITSSKSEAIDRKTFGYLRIADKLNEELNNYNDKLTSELEDIIDTI